MIGYQMSAQSIVNAQQVVKTRFPLRDLQVKVTGVTSQGTVGASEAVRPTLPPSDEASAGSSIAVPVLDSSPLLYTELTTDSPWRRGSRFFPDSERSSTAMPRPP
jgi:hypothetical protein